MPGQNRQPKTESGNFSPESLNFYTELFLIVSLTANERRKFMSAKYKILAEDLRQLLKNPTFDPSGRLPTEQEIGNTYHVSRQTVRQALSLLAEEGLIEKRQGSGTYRSASLSLSASASRTIAVLTPHLHKYSFSELLQDIQALFSDAGFNTRVYSTENYLMRERTILESLLVAPPRGLLICATHSSLPNPNIDLYRKLLSSGTRAVFLGRRYDALPEIPQICADDYAGGYALASWLIQEQHTRLGGIFRSDTRSGIDRFSGCIAALRDRHLSFEDPHFFWYDTIRFDRSDSHFDPQLLEPFLSMQTAECTALICQDDELACLAIQTLRGMNIRVPQDVSVVTFERTVFSRLSPVTPAALTTGSGKLWEIAANSLLAMIRNLPFSIPTPVWIPEKGESLRQYSLFAIRSSVSSSGVNQVSST